MYKNDPAISYTRKAPQILSTHHEASAFVKEVADLH